MVLWVYGLVCECMVLSMCLSVWSCVCVCVSVGLSTSTTIKWIQLNSSGLKTTQNSVEIVLQHHVITVCVKCGYLYQHASGWREVVLCVCTPLRALDSSLIASLPQARNHLVTLWFLITSPTKVSFCPPAYNLKASCYECERLRGGRALPQCMLGGAPARGGCLLPSGSFVVDPIGEDVSWGPQLDRRPPISDLGLILLILVYIHTYIYIYIYVCIYIYVYALFFLFIFFIFCICLIWYCCFLYFLCFVRLFL